jgi:hypothetical protein
MPSANESTRHPNLEHHHPDSRENYFVVPIVVFQEAFLQKFCVRILFLKDKITLPVRLRSQKRPARCQIHSKPDVKGVNVTEVPHDQFVIVLPFNLCSLMQLHSSS